MLQLISEQLNTIERSWPTNKNLQQFIQHPTFEFVLSSRLYDFFGELKTEIRQLEAEIDTITSTMLHASDLLKREMIRYNASRQIDENLIKFVS